MQLETLIRIARGEEPADLLLENARLVDVLNGEIRPATVALAGGRIVGFGPCPARNTLDLRGAFLAPGFLDAHVHVESSLVPPSEFARAVVPRGTTTVIADPHEIANVAGMAGIRFLLADAGRSPLGFFVMAPACVPSTPFETSGARLGAEDLLELLDEEPRMLGLAEVMDVPGVLAGQEDLMDKLRAFAGRAIDGHSPGLGGRELAAYRLAGPDSDHECTTPEEALEKLRVGMMIFLREGSGARNLRDLLPAITPENHHRFAFCTDDLEPRDLRAAGHIDHLVRLAIAGGVPPINALRMATWNPACHFGLTDRGALTPGRRADLVVFDDLEAPHPRLVFVDGQLVAGDGEMLLPRSAAHPEFPTSLRIAWEQLDLTIPAHRGKARVIGLIPDQLTTDAAVAEPRRHNGSADADPEHGLLKVAVIERHRGSGAVGKGFLRGLGLRRGALASTVAHDHHNLVVVGADDASMITAAHRVADLGGGMVAALGERVLAEVPLPLAGLMSDRPIEEVERQLDAAVGAARELGSTLNDPFLAISFLALPVIPHLKITDQGLVDVDQGRPVPLWVGD